MTIYWTDADVSHLSQMSHYPHGWACYGSKPFFFLKKVAKKFGEGKMFDVPLHRLSKFSKTSVRL